MLSKEKFLVIANKKWVYHLILFILSLAMIYPIYYIANTFLNFGDPAGIKSEITWNHDDQLLSSVNQFKTWNLQHDLDCQLSYIFFLINGILLILISSLYFHKFKGRDTSKIFVLMCGALGIGFFLYPMTFFEKDIKIRRYMSVKFFLPISELFIFIFTLMLLISNGNMAQINGNALVSNSKVYLSTKSGNENLIEICVDSFDNNLSMPYFENENFKDFYYFDKFVTPGFYTDDSEKAIYTEEVLNNKWVRAKYEGWDPKYTIDLKYNFQESLLYHLTKIGTFKNFAVMNQGFSSEAIKNVETANNISIPSFSYLNSTNTRNPKKFSIDNDTSEKNIVDTFGKSIQISDDPGRVFYSSGSLHHPFYSDEDGNNSLFLGDPNYSSNEMRNYSKPITLTENLIVDILDYLKNTSDQFGNLYDNTMIVIYGDHSSHSNLPPSIYGKQGAVVEKNRSPLLIKYPHTTLSSNSPQLIDDVAIYGVHLEKIIENYFNHKNDDQLSWMRSNQNFSLNRKFISYNYYWQGSKAFITKFDGDTLRLENSMNGSPVFSMDDPISLISSEIVGVEWR